MTRRLYYDDSLRTTFRAQVIERTMHEALPAFVLNETYFYPTSGGQPHDTGRIGGARVMDVRIREADKAIVHVLEADPGSNEGFDAVIDWPRRFDLMQQHTGQHILTQAFIREAGANTIAFHLSMDSLYIDLDRAVTDTARIDAAETLANTILWEDRPVTAREVSWEEAEASGARIRGVPRDVDKVRIIDIGSFDIGACGGTHVTRTGAIGLIKITRVEKKGDKTRIEFVCGGRALADYRAKHGAATRAGGLLSVKLDDVPTAIERLQSELREVKQDMKVARVSLTVVEAKDLLKRAEPLNKGGQYILQVFEDRPIEELRALANALVANSGTIALLGSAGEKGIVLGARSKDRSEDMKRLIQGAGALIKARIGGPGASVPLPGTSGGFVVGSPAMALAGGNPADPGQVQRALQGVVERLQL